MPKDKTIGFRQHMADCLNESLQEYLRDMDGQPCLNLHKMTVGIVEEELLKLTLKQCQGNLSAAAKMLGISRTTLGKKMTLHNIKRP